MKHTDLSVGEVAQQLKEPYHRVIRRIKRGELPGAYKVGWGWIIPKSAIKEMDTFKDNLRKLTRQKVDAHLISKDFEFIPSYKLRKALNRK